MELEFLEGAEGPAHAKLKRSAIEMLRRLGCHSITTEGKIQGFKGTVDVLGRFDNGRIAVEVGDCSKGRIETLKQHAEVVIHIPYTWTPNLVRWRTAWRQIDRIMALHNGGG